MTLYGFKIYEYDEHVYVKDTKHEYFIVCLYINDMLIVDGDDKMIMSIKNMLISRFFMKYIGLADVLGSK